MTLLAITHYKGNVFKSMQNYGGMCKPTTQTFMPIGLRLI